jgi:hypothetical protein
MPTPPVKTSTAASAALATTDIPATVSPAMTTMNVLPEPMTVQLMHHAQIQTVDSSVLVTQVISAMVNLAQATNVVPPTHVLLMPTASKLLLVSNALAHLDSLVTVIHAMTMTNALTAATLVMPMQHALITTVDTAVLAMPDTAVMVDHAKMSMSAPPHHVTPMHLAPIPMAVMNVPAMTVSPVTVNHVTMLTNALLVLVMSMHLAPTL